MGKGLFRLLPVRFDNGLVDDSVIQVISCLPNDPQKHMMEYEDESDDQDMEIDEASEEEDVPAASSHPGSRKLQGIPSSLCAL